MIKKEKQKHYYETNVITGATCDVCGKDLTDEDEKIIRVQLRHYYFQEKATSLGDYEMGLTKELCEKCAEPISDILGGGIEVYI